MDKRHHPLSKPPLLNPSARLFHLSRFPVEVTVSVPKDRRAAKM
ncbi:hypothetical protein ABHI18_001592 [Aspergillus niger]